MLHKITTTLLLGCGLVASAMAAQAQERSDVVARLNAALYAPDVIESSDTDVRRFYELRGHLPVWWQGDGWHDHVELALVWLARADTIGLSPERYAAANLAALIDPLVAHGLTDEDIATLEIALTDALLTYARDRQTGRIDPTVTGWMSQTTIARDTPKALVAAVEEGDLVGWITALTPEREGYARLLPELSRYRALAVLDWPAITAGDSIKPGASDPRVTALRTRLEHLGDLSVATVHDGGDIYDDALVDAISRFQARHGLDADGVVGRKTLVALNVTPAERALTITANLERMRWIPAQAELGERHVEVNLPNFELVAYEAGEPSLVMPVVVGAPEHRTPILSDRIVNLKFAPTWTVPHKIAKDEILPKLQEDPTWLATNSFRVFADWGATNEVDPETIDWTEMTASSFAYMLRQDPSESSALGLVRFSLTNEFDIFLHDTGARSVFARTERSLSHGCVRVGDPAGLAQFALATESTAWTAQEVDEALTAEETHYQSLSQPLPVHLMYLTAWVDDAGQMQFRGDIYDEDTELLALMETADDEVVIELPVLIGSLDPIDAPEIELALAD
ncbi:MAG: L,D-transpeptidase family protein [Rhodospirillaceae bacterium]|nr:L,D-transpeptidase family protein [Rhodospirillaceae bacterium]